MIFHRIGQSCALFPCCLSKFNSYKNRRHRHLGWASCWHGMWFPFIKLLVVVHHSSHFCECLLCKDHKIHFSHWFSFLALFEQMRSIHSISSTNFCVFIFSFRHIDKSSRWSNNENYQKATKSNKTQQQKQRQTRQKIPSKRLTIKFSEKSPISMYGSCSQLIQSFQFKLSNP